ncbi:MAG: hypothetical protein HOQ22_14570, partial [Nocardioidaceae bacterium]|nr:hypothetical protein [Nocardioidaceae bacterium]
MALGWPQALAWRMRRQLLHPVGGEPVEGVVHRLGAIPAASDAELAVRVRRERSGPGEVAGALTDGRLVRTFAWRGATHLMTAEDAGTYLSLRAVSRMWERRSWQSHYDLAPSDWPPLRAAVREALADGPLTVEELAAAVTAHRRFAHLGPAFADRSATILKPFAWQGDFCLAASPPGRLAFQRLDDNPRWTGVPDADEAGPRAVEAYVAGYGPATPGQLEYWLGTGLGAGRKRVHRWVAGLADRLATVDVEGEPALVRREDVDDLRATEPASVVRLLPGHDQWVLGPGTADPHLVPPDRRPLVTRGAHLVVAGGVLSGTWRLGKDALTVACFAEAGPVPRDAVAAEADRVSGLVERP